MPRISLEVPEPASTKRTEKTGASAALEALDGSRRTRDIIYRHFLGQDLKHIAAIYEMSVFLVEQVLESPMAKAELARLRRPVEQKLAEAQERIISMTGRALERQEELLESENPHVAHRVIVDVLDRAGLKAVDRSEKQVFDMAKLLEVAYARRKEREAKANDADGWDHSQAGRADDS